MEAETVRIRNVSVSGQKVTSRWGFLNFDADGYADVPADAAKALGNAPGYSVVSKPSGDAAPVEALERDEVGEEAPAVKIEKKVAKKVTKRKKK